MGRDTVPTISVLAALRAALPGVAIAALRRIPVATRARIAREAALTLGYRLSCDRPAPPETARMDAPAALRSVALSLDEFCDRRRPYPEMVADAARRAASTIDVLRLTRADARTTSVA